LPHRRLRTSASRTATSSSDYTDIIYPGGFEPKIERVYNSKTPYKGIFGWGWGSEYEVKLTVSADGSVVVHEYGGGADNRFSPRAFDSSEMVKAVDMITGAAQKAGMLASQAQIEQYKKRLRGDATFRNEEWENFRGQGKLQERQLTAGTVLLSNQFSFQSVTKVADGYVRNFDNGRIEKFDLKGKLLRIQDKNNNFIELAYGKDGHLAKIVDNFNRKIFVTFNEKGLVEKIDGENSKLATYKYDELDQLIQTKDVDGNVYGYKYSKDKRHNLTQVAYGDGTHQDVDYYAKDQHENVKSVIDRDGTSTQYSYVSDKRDRDHFTVKVDVSGADGHKLSTSSYEYQIKYKADGSEWTYKIATTLDGDKTETTYNECCNLPIKIVHNGEETGFTYDAKGHVTRKISPSEITELTYDSKVSKVARVEKSSKTDNSKEWSSFSYDDKGNLMTAKNSEGKGVKLNYDRNGRISMMVDQSHRVITFKYNENSKPIEIRDPKVGAITVTYTNAGEIKKVESTAGRKIALQVTSAFQNLLDIIRPAGSEPEFLGRNATHPLSSRVIMRDVS